MDIKRLEVFCRVVELKSFTRAAEAVLLTQPTVSENIRLLEESLGERLLDRLGREVLPTPAGDLFYRYARRMLQLQAEALQALAEFRGHLRGELRVGASTIPGTYLLPGLLESFRRVHPDIRIVLQVAGTGRMFEGLLQGEVEIGLVGGREKESRLEFTPAFGDELVLVVPPGHPWADRGAIDPAELAGQPFLQREPGSATRAVMETACKARGVDPKGLDIVAELGSSEAIRQGVKAGLGLAILSSLAVTDDLAHGTLRTVAMTGLSLARPFYLASRRGRALSPLATAFREYLVAAGGRPETMPGDHAEAGS
jgi:DNA-binding transcriptional LysR family regulator